MLLSGGLTMIERYRPKPRPRRDVGYGRPPKETQFKPGKSGNPKGRPKGTRSPAAILQAIIAQRVAVTKDGKTCWLSTLEITFRQLANDAMRGDQKAIKLLLSLVERYGEAPEVQLRIEELLAEDRDILKNYLPDLTKSRRAGGRRSSGGA